MEIEPQTCFGGMEDFTPFQAVKSISHTQDNQTAIAEMLVQFPDTRDNEPPSQLKVTGWGNTAQRLQEQCQVGQHYVLEGRLQMNLVQREGFEEKVAEMHPPLGQFGQGASGGPSRSRSRD